MTAAITSHKKLFNPAGCDLAVPVPLLLEHDQSIGPVGEVFQMRKSPTEVSIRAALYPDRFGYGAWLLIKDGQLTGLSIGIGYGRGEFHIFEKDGIDCFTRFRIAEVSLCFKPANKECHFRIDPSGAQKMLHPSLTAARELLAKTNKLIKSFTKDSDDVEMCIIDLLESGECDDEDEARERCEEIYGEEAVGKQRKRTPEAEKLARMHPDSRRLLLELRRNKGRRP